ncbi:putative 3-hydroxyisobutyryl-CoA hydrolase [Helianthus annuus]|nr:putative 3-hydroxyisobutyryl-CoA hydrolase [Helianthus annuus]
MGGGATIAIHGRFRVVTDNTLFAMPETALGSFPDVGASYYLSRLPGFFGEYVGLTGARLDGAEMLACGLATHFVPLEKLSSLEDALCKATTGDPKIINNIILHDFSNKNPTLKEKSHYFRYVFFCGCHS